MAAHARLREVRKSEGMTQAVFASKFEISRAAYINYESGDRELPTSLVVSLHKELAIDPTWLLTGRGAKTAEIHYENIKIASSAVRQFAISQNLDIEPEEVSSLVLLIVKHLDAVEYAVPSEIRTMLENAA